MDIKIGSVRHHCSASKRKIARQTAKSLASSSFYVGVLVVGASFYSSDGMPQERGKKRGQPMATGAAVHECIWEFLSTPGLRDAAHAWVFKLIEVFLEQTQMRFVGSSLLLAYDDAKLRPHTLEPPPRASESFPRLRMCMIDFAHVHHAPPSFGGAWVPRADALDSDYLSGLLFLRRALKTPPLTFTCRN